VEEMKKAGVKELQGNEWKIEGNLVLKEGKVYVSKKEELRAEIIRLHYDVPAVEHGGRWKTVELVTRNYWWPGVTRDIGKYIEGCVSRLLKVDFIFISSFYFILFFLFLFSFIFYF